MFLDMEQHGNVQHSMASRHLILPLSVTNLILPFTLYPCFLILIRPLLSTVGPDQASEPFLENQIINGPLQQCLCRLQACLP